MFGQSLALRNLRLGILGDLVQDAMGGFPEIPDSPLRPRVNPQAAQKIAAEGNLAILPTLEDIASGVDSFNLRQRNKNLTEAIPGYTNLVADSSGTLGSWLRGEIPQDVAGQVSRSAAAKSLAGGYGGSGMAGALEARDLGLTSMDIKGKGLSFLPGYLQTMSNVAIPRPFDVTTGFLSPTDQILSEQWNEMNRFSTEWLQNRLDAIPDPAKAAIAKDLGGMTDALVSMIPYVGTAYGMLGQSGGGGSGGGMGGIMSLFGGGGGGAAGAAGAAAGGGSFFGM